MSSWSNNTAPEQVDQFLSSPIKENWPFRPQVLFLNPLNAHRLKPNAKGPKSPSYVVLGGSLAIFTLATNLSWEEKITQQEQTVNNMVLHTNQNALAYSVDK